MYNYILYYIFLDNLIGLSWIPKYFIWWGVKSIIVGFYSTTKALIYNDGYEESSKHNNNLSSE